jgi:hypothetical protein
MFANVLSRLASPNIHARNSSAVMPSNGKGTPPSEASSFAIRE